MCAQDETRNPRGARDDQRALVLFSGGQDSAICLAWALDRFARVDTIAFDYGQRHSVELQCRGSFVKRLYAEFPQWAPKCGKDHVLDIRLLASINETSLTQNIEISVDERDIPTTFVPGRNVLFLTYSAAIAYKRGIRHIVGGMCETDYSGYPDCRDTSIKAMAKALDLGMGSAFAVHTPLMWLDKSETWQLAEQIGGEKLVELVCEHTHTCYLGARTKRHQWGYGCGSCPACRLRAAGFMKYLAKQRRHANDVDGTPQRTSSPKKSTT